MSRFRFALARLLHVRQLGEGLAREAWAEAQRAVREAEERRERLGDELERALASLLEAQLRPALSPSEVLVRQAATDDLRRALHRNGLRLALLRERAEGAREAFERARRERESLDKLEHRWRARHRVREEELENRALDEVAVRRATRALSAGAARSRPPEDLPTSLSATRTPVIGPSLLRDGAPTP